MRFTELRRLVFCASRWVCSTKILKTVFQGVEFVSTRNCFKPRDCNEENHANICVGRRLQESFSLDFEIC